MSKYMNQGDIPTVQIYNSDVKNIRSGPHWTAFWGPGKISRILRLFSRRKTSRWELYVTAWVD